jgi:predicted adenine nucleotide alpha hydrolase (AANH) superfamily ATPase
MNILVHSCCAPCATASVEKLITDGQSPFLYFYNPNIHPYTEFRGRLESFKQFLAASNLPGGADETYGLESFIEAAPALKRPERCIYCYEVRLMRAAFEAANRKLPKFTTTLTISPYQDHELIKQAGMKAAQEYGVEFAYYDFRPLYRKSRQMAKDEGYYMQKYCGCIFSEGERYDPAKGGLG